MKGPAVDLHAHTIASDGLLTGPQVVELARRTGLHAVAITDHDALGQLEAAVRHGRTAGVEVVCGIELSATHGGAGQAAPRGALGSGEVHILGYFIDPGANPLKHLVFDLVQHRQQRAEAMLERLQGVGVDISQEALRREVGRGAPGRPHVARALVRAGVAGSQREAFERYLLPGRPGYVSRHKLSPRQAVAAIHAAGGVAVLAHPGLVAGELDPVALKAWELDGLEVRHPAHTAALACRYRRVARLQGLLPSGGSDFHGPDDDHGELGAVYVPHAWLTALAAKAG